MIILGTPDDLSGFIAVDEDDGFILQQKGEKPLYMDNGYLWFKRTNRLIKLIQKLGLKAEF